MSIRPSTKWEHFLTFRSWGKANKIPSGFFFHITDFCLPPNKFPKGNRFLIPRPRVVRVKTPHSDYNVERHRRRLRYLHRSLCLCDRYASSTSRLYDIFTFSETPFNTYNISNITRVARRQSALVWKLPGPMEIQYHPGVLYTFFSILYTYILSLKWKKTDVLVFRFLVYLFRSVPI